MIQAELLFGLQLTFNQSTGWLASSIVNSLRSREAAGAVGEPELKTVAGSKIQHVTEADTLR